MNKHEFLSELRKQLTGLPQEDIEERLNFYQEIIEDRIEEGLTEEQAVLAAGPIDKIAPQIIAETPFAKIAKERFKEKKKLSTLELLLLILGFPLWFPLLISAFSIGFTLIISLWSVLLSIWAAFISIAICSLGSFLSGLGLLFNGRPFAGVAMMGAGVLLAGISIFFYLGCKGATKGSSILTKKLLFSIKNFFIKKERPQ